MVFYGPVPRRFCGGYIKERQKLKAFQSFLEVMIDKAIIKHKAKLAEGQEGDKVLGFAQGSNGYFGLGRLDEGGMDMLEIPVGLATQLSIASKCKGPTLFCIVTLTLCS